MDDALLQVIWSYFNTLLYIIYEIRVRFVRLLLQTVLDTESSVGNYLPPVTRYLVNLQRFVGRYGDTSGVCGASGFCNVWCRSEYAGDVCIVYYALN